MLDLEKQIFRQIEKEDNILLIFNKNGDGDSLASSLGLFLFLKNMRKNVDIVGIDGNHKTSLQETSGLSFLPSYNKIDDNLRNIRRFIVSLNIKNTKVDQIKYSVDDENLNFIVSPSSGWFSDEDVSSRAGEFKYNLIISIGLSDLESIGGVYDENVEFFYKTTIINIDNTPENEEFGQINFIDLNTSTKSELIYYLLKNYNSSLISEDIATCLLAGIINKTKNFKIGNLGPKTLLNSSELIDLGAKRDEIIKHLFYSKNLDSLKVWGKILNNLKSEMGGLLVWSKVDNFEKVDNVDDIVDEIISSLPKAEVFALLIKVGVGETLIKLFSLRGFNIKNLTDNTSIITNKYSSSYSIKQDIDTAEIEFISELKEKIKKHT